MANSASDVLKLIKDKEIEWVDLRFTDPKGKWQHLSMVSGVVGEDVHRDRADDQGLQEPDHPGEPGCRWPGRGRRERGR